MRYAAQVSLVVSLGGFVQFLPICLPCEPSVTALCAIVTAMHCVCRYEMLTQGSVTAYTCNDTKATKEPEMHGDLQEEPGLEPGAAAAPKEACNETKAAEEPEMQGDLQEEPRLVPGAAAAPKQARVRGHGGKPFSEAEEDELRRGNPNPNPNPNPTLGPGGVSRALLARVPHSRPDMARAGRHAGRLRQGELTR